MAGLGHECGGGCPDLVTEWEAAVWFVRLHGTAGGASGTRTLVEVEFRNPPYAGPPLRELLAEVNRCAQDDYVQVSERRVRDPAS